MHSVFDSSVNILTSGSLLSVVGRKHYNGPNRIVIKDDNFNFRKILKQDEPVKIDSHKLFFSPKGSIQTNGLIVNLENSYRWSPEVKKRYVNKIDTELITGKLKNYSFVKPKKINEFKNAVKISDKSLFNSVVDDLIGLGQGLTPSGDDFLVGFISASHFFTKSKPFGFFLKNVKINHSKTNFISSQYLKYAVEGKISEVISSTIVASAEKKPEACGWISKLVNTGATSGHDTLFGILSAIEVYNACKFNKEKFLS